MRLGGFGFTLPCPCSVALKKFTYMLLYIYCNIFFLCSIVNILIIDVNDFKIVKIYILLLKNKCKTGAGRVQNLWCNNSIKKVKKQVG